MRINSIKVYGLAMCSYFFCSSFAYAFDCQSIPPPLKVKPSNFFLYDQQLCQRQAENLLAKTSLKYDINTQQQHHDFWQQDSNNEANDFWYKWNNDFAVDPIFSEYNDYGYYGLGFWLPKQFDNEKLASVTGVEDWVLNHGIQMSVGFGKPNSDDTRVRIDYRWHSKNDVDDGISLQVHMPLK